MRLVRVQPLAAMALVCSVVLVGCSAGRTTPPTTASPSNQSKQTHPELKEPFEQALKALKGMGEKGEKKEYTGAQDQFTAFSDAWRKIQPALAKDDPRLANHIGDGATELDLEFKKPPDAMRPWEFTEEASKLGRLLGQAAGQLGVPLDKGLIPPDPSANLPFNAQKRITITLSEHKIEPAKVDVPQHTKVTFVVRNAGKEVHEFAVGHYGVELAEIKPGETRELTLVVTDAGDWEVACHLPGHFEVGMFGTLKVTPATLNQ